MEKKPDAPAPVGTYAKIEANLVPFATNGIDCPTIYADVLRGLMVTGEVTKFNLVQHKMDAIKEEIQAVHVATIVLPTSQIRAWATLFKAVADQSASVKLDGE